MYTAYSRLDIYTSRREWVRVCACVQNSPIPSAVTVSIRSIPITTRFPVTHTPSSSVDFAAGRGNRYPRLILNYKHPASELCVVHFFARLDWGGERGAVDVCEGEFVMWFICMFDEWRWHVCLSGAYARETSQTYITRRVTHIQTIVDRVPQNLEILSQNSIQYQAYQVSPEFIIGTCYRLVLSRQSYGQNSGTLTKFWKSYGVASISRLLKIVCFFCRISSLS